MSMLRIKYELISRGISQTEFAKSAGLKPQAVSRIVNGLEPPYTKRGERIAAALGWEGDPSELFEEVTMYAKPTTLGQLQAENDRLREQIDAAHMSRLLTENENESLRELVRLMWKPFCWAQSYGACLTDEQDAEIRDKVRELGVVE